MARSGSIREALPVLVCIRLVHIIREICSLSYFHIQEPNVCGKSRKRCTYELNRIKLAQSRFCNRNHIKIVESYLKNASVKKINPPVTFKLTLTAPAMCCPSRVELWTNEVKSTNKSELIHWLFVKFKKKNPLNSRKAVTRGAKCSESSGTSGWKKVRLWEKYGAQFTGELVAIYNLKKFSVSSERDSK